jgi:nucleotide-binding universal stress UspA family protein
MTQIAELTGEAPEGAARERPVAAKTYNHILVALDGSPLAEEILSYVEPLARTFGSRVTLVRAISPVESGLLLETPAGPMNGSGDMASIVGTFRRRADEYLAGVRERLEGKGFPVECEYAEGVPVADLIAERARSLGVDLIAMTTHGRSGLRWVLTGSVAEGVLRSAPCPVLIVHPDGRI